jgi:hypothetical protein
VFILLRPRVEGRDLVGVAESDTGRAVRLDFASLHEVDRWTNGAGRGALTGGLLGALLGVFLLMDTGGDCATCDPESDSKLEFIFTAGGAMIGLILGGMIGAIIGSQDEEWRSIYPVGTRDETREKTPPIW